MSVKQMVKQWKNRTFDSETPVLKGSLHSKAVFGNPFDGGIHTPPPAGGVVIKPGMILFSNKTPCQASRVEIGADGRPERRRV